jgi:hypothetical protein
MATVIDRATREPRTTEDLIKSRLVADEHVHRGELSSQEPPSASWLARQ